MKIWKAFVLVLLLLAGCYQSRVDRLVERMEASANAQLDNPDRPRFQMIVNKYEVNPSGCSLKLIATSNNTIIHEAMETDRLSARILTFDQQGNTISESYVNFATMKPGKQNAQDVYVNAPCVAIKQVDIDDSRVKFAGAIILPRRFTW